jgi:methyltransferase (TIGR00027 family)
VFEVDLAFLQQHKRLLSADWPVLARTLVYVPGDLGGADWPTELLDRGFEPEKPTDWIAEGVCTYLQPEAIDGLLRQVSRLSPPGSSVCLTYNEDSLVRKLISRVTSGWGEPHRFFSTPHDMASRLRGAGFEVREDTDGLERARRIRRPIRFSDRAWTRTHHVVWAWKTG